MSDEPEVLEIDNEDAEEIKAGSLVLSPTINAILAPGKAYEVLDKRPLASMWILLWILIGMIGLAVVNLDVTKQFSRVGIVESMARRGQEVDPEQISSMFETMDRFALVGAVAQNLLLIILVLVVAVVIWAGATMLGGSARFSRATAVATVGAVVHPLLATAYIGFNWWLDPPEIRRMADIANAVPTLGLDLLFGSPDMSFMTRTVLMRVDLFNRLVDRARGPSGCERLLRLKSRWRHRPRGFHLGGVDRDHRPADGTGAPGLADSGRARPSLTGTLEVGD